MEPDIQSRGAKDPLHHLQHNAAAPSNRHPPVSKKEDELGWGSSGIHKVRLLMLIVNTGFLPESSRSSQALALTPGKSVHAEREDAHVRSWRSSGSYNGYCTAWAEAGEGQDATGMGGHVKRLLKLREDGRLKRLAVLGVDQAAVPAASMHLEALHSLKRNRQYRKQELQALLHNLVVQERLLRPALGQTPFEFEHPLTNTLPHPVLCAAFLVSIDAEDVAEYQRAFLLQPGYLRLMKHSLAVPPAEVPEHLRRENVFLAFLQPSAEVRMRMELANSLEAWQLKRYSARVLVQLLRTAGTKDVLSEYEINFTFAPLPVVCKHRFRFFQAHPRLQRTISVTLPAVAKPHSIVPVLDHPHPPVPVGVESDSRLEVEADPKDAKKSLQLKISLDLDEIEDKRQFSRRTEIKGTGWWNRSMTSSSCAVTSFYVILRDSIGSVIDRWQFEIFRVKHKVSALPRTLCSTLKAF